MLLIAVAGPVGAGKTTLLGTLAEWSRAQGLQPDGFLARAERRENPLLGASRYELVWVADGRVVPFAARAGPGRPAYVFREEALAQAREWAAGLRAGPPRPLVVLDEFGLLEARGEGHLALWPDLVAAAPEVVVIAVRQEVLDAVARKLDRPFDLVIHTEDPGAWETLRAACREHRDWMRIGGYGAGAGAIEMGLGSALHGLRVPLRGLVLSSLQASVMTLAGAGLGRRGRVVWVPFLAAGLKALSPAGNRLRPMLAITMQGLLYGGAVRLLGWNALGVGLGGWLVGAWAAAQGIVLQWLLVGDQLLRAYETLTGWIESHGHLSTPGLWSVVGLWIALWGTVASVATLVTWRRRALPRRFTELMGRRLEGLRDRDRVPPSRRLAVLQGLRDLTRPAFWGPLLLIAIVILAAGAPWGVAFWMVARAVAIGFVVFAAARSFEPRRLAGWLRRRGRWGPAEALERALEQGTGDESGRTRRG
jgi:nucleoside-triphosphatase THEP1